MLKVIIWSPRKEYSILYWFLLGKYLLFTNILVHEQPSGMSYVQEWRFHSTLLDSFYDYSADMLKPVSLLWLILKFFKLIIHAQYILLELVVVEVVYLDSIYSWCPLILSKLSIRGSYNDLSSLWWSIYFLIAKTQPSTLFSIWLYFFSCHPNIFVFDSYRFSKVTFSIFMNCLTSLALNALSAHILL